MPEIPQDQQQQNEPKPQRQEPKPLPIFIPRQPDTDKKSQDDPLDIR